MLGKGGYGEVYYGYKGAGDQNSDGGRSSQTSGRNVVSLSPNNSSNHGKRTEDQVAIKLEK
jgi:hypothetical protein